MSRPEGTPFEWSVLDTLQSASETLQSVEVTLERVLVAGRLGRARGWEGGSGRGWVVDALGSVLDTLQSVLETLEGVVVTGGLGGGGGLQRLRGDEVALPVPKPETRTPNP